MWKRIIREKLRNETNVSENEFGFMPEISTMEAINLLFGRVIERFRENKTDLTYGIY